MSDLRGQLLLHLQAAREDFDDAGELGDADDAVGRQVADMRAADDRRHVVFAVRSEFDVAQHDHFVVAGHFFERAAQFLGRIVGVAGEPVFVGVDHAFGRVYQTFARRVVAGPAQQHAHGILGLSLGDGRGLGRFLFHFGIVKQNRGAQFSAIATLALSDVIER